MYLKNTLRIIWFVFFLGIFLTFFYLINFKFGNLSTIVQNKTQLFFNFILFISIIIYFISFFLSEKMNLIIFFSGLLFYVSILFIEAYLQYSSLKFVKGNLEEKKIIYKNNTGKIYDERSKFEFYKHLKKKHAELSVPITVSMVSSSNQINEINFFPLSGISNTKTVHCNENGYFTTYESDRFGFNNNDKKWLSEKERKVILLGDSFVHGACVFRKDSIAGLLQNLNENTEIYNLAYSEHGPLEQLATLREYSELIKPTDIIWFYFEGNDLADLSGALKNKYLINYIKYKDYKQNLIDKVNLSDKMYKNILLDQIKKKEIEFNSFKFNYENLIKLSFIRKSFLNYFIKPKEPFEEFEQIIRQVQDYTKNNYIKLHIVYLPDFSRYYFEKENDMSYLNYKKILKIFEKLEINVIDINKELFLNLKNKKSLFPFERFGHYNEEGYNLITNIINEKISFN